MVEITRLQDCQEKTKVPTVERGKVSNGDQRNNFSRPYARANGEVPRHMSTVGNFQVGASGCILCGEEHSVFKCKTYPTADQRKVRVFELRLCYKCLCKGHRSADCPNQDPFCSSCRVSGHHGALCFKARKEPRTTQKQPRPAAVANATNVATINALAAGCGKTTVLPTAMLKIVTNHGSKVVRALFDQGAQRSFMKRGTLDEGEVPSEPTTLVIDGFQTQGSEMSYDVAKITVELSGHDDVQVDVIIVDSLAERLVMNGVGDLAARLAAKGRNLADKFENTVHYPIDVLIGADHYYDFVFPAKRDEGITIIPSKVGDLLSGPITKTPGKSQVNVITALKVAVTGKEAERDVDLLWKLDTIGISPEEAHPDDKAALDQFSDSLNFKDGHYVARLPWKASHPTLPINYRLAQGRLASGLKRMREDPKLLQNYDEVMKDQLQRGFIEKVSVAERSVSLCHYIPHHAVKKESPTTPIRIVFDCSSKPNVDAVSLNDCLYSGPSMVPELPQMLMRFRLGKLAACSDIAKAFLMVGLDERDRDFTRFLWPRDPTDPSSPIDIFRFKVILFGATCSQFILNATIDYHLEKYEGEKDITDKIRRNIYVDNLLGTASTTPELLNFYSKSKNILGEAGLCLREWATNDPELQKLAEKAGECDTRTTVPVLGLRWDTVEDSLKVAPRILDTGKPTKRSILRGLAAQFDPLGILTPVTIQAKMLMKAIWLLKVDWDEELPSEVADKWNKIKHQMEKMKDISIQRHAGIGKSMTLHTFVDASTVAYGAVVYGVNKGKATLLMAKGRIAPATALSVPRLELTAAVIGAKLTKYVSEAYSQEVEIESEHIWSDSKVALGWIHSACPLEAYMQNRKVEIKKTLPDAKWHYVPTGQNPADLITRGTSAKKLKESQLWWHGPETILEPQDWEVYPTPVHTVTMSTTKETPEQVSFLSSVANRCGSYRKVVTTIAWIRRFVSNLKKKPRNTERCYEQNLTVEENKSAECWIIRKLQSEEFQQESAFLHGGNQVGNPPLIKQLRLQMRGELIVVVSRITEADVDDSVKYPILLPSTHRITSLIIEELHRKHHQGINHIVTSLRQRWWVPRARQRVKSVIKGCMSCRRERGTPYQRPPIPPLPVCRVSQARPFAATGVDYAGPLYVKEGTQTVKRYVALYTCASTRAIHLELAKDLSAEAFLRTLQRFSARRSYPQMLVSDNGTNFVSSAKILKSWEEHHSVRSTLNQHGCKWQFNPSRAPWFGGFFERMVKMVKVSLQKTLFKAMVTDDELHTVLCEIEADLNDRPLTCVSTSEDDQQPLTPSQLMIGFRLDSTPIAIQDPEEEEDPTVFNTELLSRRQKNVQRVLQRFQTRFRNEYLTSLRQGVTRNQGSMVPAVGDIVQVKDDGPRISWNLGRVLELHRGIDGHVRSVKLKLRSGITTRPVTLLYPLEITAESGQENSVSPATKRVSDREVLKPFKIGSGSTNPDPGLQVNVDQNISPVNEPNTARPSRKAALEARKRILTQLE